MQHTEEQLMLVETRMETQSLTGEEDESRADETWRDGRLEEGPLVMKPEKR